MIWGDLVRLVVLGLLFGGGQNPPPGPSVPAGPFPSTKPTDLPPWPAGWCPDLPPPPEVVARAWELLPTLWEKGEGTRTQEMTGGRWITYVATMVDGQKSVAAYRTTDCEPAVPSPVPVVTPQPSATPPSPATPVPGTDPQLQGAAITMNEALKLRGYKKADMVLYQAFQQRAGLIVDGYPGTVTMLKLETVLQSAGQQLANVKIYPWKATGGYDGVNAPTLAEWEGTAVPPTSPIIPGNPPPPAAVVVPPQPAPMPAPVLPPPPLPPIVPASVVTPLISNPAALAMNAALSAHGYKQSDMGLYRAFQSSAGLTADGYPGTNTMLKLETVLQAAGVPVANVKVYPWKSTGGYDGTNAPTQAEWYGTAAPTPSPAVVPAVFNVPPVGPTVSTSTDVQHALNQLGYKGKDGNPLTEDGKIGPNSQYAIAAFQREHPPLAVDSTAGPLTKAALSAALGRLSQAA